MPILNRALSHSTCVSQASSSASSSRMTGTTATTVMVSAWARTVLELPLKAAIATAGFVVVDAVTVLDDRFMKAGTESAFLHDILGVAHDGGLVVELKW